MCSPYKSIYERESKSKTKYSFFKKRKDHSTVDDPGANRSMPPPTPRKKCHKKMAYHGGPTDFMSFGPLFLASESATGIFVD